MDSHLLGLVVGLVVWVGGAGALAAASSLLPLEAYLLTFPLYFLNMKIETNQSIVVLWKDKVEWAVILS
jgi:hypothetical protein